MGGDPPDEENIAVYDYTDLINFPCKKIDFAGTPLSGTVLKRGSPPPKVPFWFFSQNTFRGHRLTLKIPGKVYSFTHPVTFEACFFRPAKKKQLLYSLN